MFFSIIYTEKNIKESYPLYYLQQSPNGRQISRHSANFSGTKATPHVKQARKDDIINCNKLLANLLSMGMRQMIIYELDFGQITIRFGDKIRPNYKKLALSKYWYVDILINTTMKICKSYILGFNNLGESYIIFFQNVRMQL